MSGKSKSPAPSTSSRSGPKKSSAPTSPLLKYYLIAFNVVSTIAWLNYGIDFVGQWVASRQPYSIPVLGTVQLLRYTQALALLEIVHAALGLVPSPLLSVTMQVASRIFTCFGSLALIAQSGRVSLLARLGYLFLSVAWTVTEAVRYPYYVGALLGWLPKGLTWLRYSLFLGLYPLGVAGELLVIYAASQVLPPNNLLVRIPFYVLAATFPPGFVYMYTYMLKQRSKVLAPGPKLHRR